MYLVPNLLNPLEPYYNAFQKVSEGLKFCLKPEKQAIARNEIQFSSIDS